MKVNLNFSNDGKKIKRKDRKAFVKLAKKTFSILKIKGTAELSLNFVSSEKIKEMNTKYRNINKKTDVLSFPIFEELSLDEKKEFIKYHNTRDLGDIFICKEIAITQAKKYGHSFKREVCFLFVHGLLHLLGYDHSDQKSEEEMFALQENILEKTRY